MADSIDRRTPARRDACRTRPTGRQTWRELLFVHWKVAAARLAELLPASLSVDLFEGRAYVGLVPFTMHDVRIGPIPVPDFLETNLRTYVHAGGVPGVWFCSLDAESAFAVWGARTFYRLPYFKATMSRTDLGMKSEYRLERDARASLDVRWTRTEATLHAAQAGTLAHFLTERYALYGPSRSGGAYRVRVHHPPWPLEAARLDGLSTTIPRAAGLEVKEPIDLVLASSKGVAVETFGSD